MKYNFTEPIFEKKIIIDFLYHVTLSRPNRSVFTFFLRIVFIFISLALKILSSELSSITF